MPLETVHLEGYVGAGQRQKVSLGILEMYPHSQNDRRTVSYAHDFGAFS